ncbi:MAG: hypothetical protein LBE91_01315 [Tannerella sp.]|jgi:hypothetical protein|nr:hypothetical protein [Tannerella sp.]
MKEIELKYDLFQIFEDRIEIKRIHKKSLLRTIYDIYTNKMIGGLLFILFSFPIGFLITNFFINPGSVIGILFVALAFPIAYYYEWHLDRIIQKNNIQKISLINGRLIINYYDGKRNRIKVVELTDDMNANEMQELTGLSIISISPSKIVEYYKINIFFSIVGFLISFLFLFRILNIPHPLVIFYVNVFLILLCFIIGIYNYYQLKSYNIRNKKVLL